LVYGCVVMIGVSALELEYPEISLGIFLFHVELLSVAAFLYKQASLFFLFDQMNKAHRAVDFRPKNSTFCSTWNKTPAPL